MHSLAHSFRLRALVLTCMILTGPACFEAPRFFSLPPAGQTASGDNPPSDSRVSSPVETDEARPAVPEPETPPPDNLPQDPPEEAEPCETDGEEDADGDALPDSCDNCPLAPNADQADRDGDGRGDACDSCDGTRYGRQIVIDRGFSDEFKQTVRSELAHWLAQVSRQGFTVVEDGAQEAECAAQKTGVYVFHSDSAALRASAPRPVLDKLGALADSYRQSFILYAQPGGGLWIVARSEEGARNGIYHILERAGVRFYFAGENWTIAPPKDDLRMAADELKVPDFHTFTMNGGGLGPGTNPVDASYRKRDRWNAWSARNMFPWEIQCNGHTGAAFNRTFAREIQADPLYHAEEDGERLTCDWAGRVALGRECSTKPHYTYTGRVSCGLPDAEVTYTDADGEKICEDMRDYSSDSGLAKLFGDWRVGLLESAVRQDPQSRAAFGVAVEPADGSHHCDCAKCRNLLRNGPYPRVDRDATDSDKVFHLSNIVARKIDRKMPGRYACLYAYNKHADVPTIPIEHNTYVSIAAYAFQRTGMTPEALIQAWARKSASNPSGRFRLGSRDYWCITDWCEDLPTQTNSEAVRKMRFWKANGLESASIETTYGMGAMGLNLYLASRLVWDAEADTDAIKEEFYRLAFGAARAPMRRLLERWNSGFYLHEHEMALSWADLAEADRLLAAAPDAAVSARVNDYKIYARYLSLKLDFWGRQRQTPANQAALDAAGNDLIRHLWKGYHSDMIQSYRMYELLRDEGGLSPSVLAAWDVRNPAAAGWASAAPYTAEELRRMSDDALRRYRPLDIDSRPYSNDLVPLSRSADPTTVPTYRFVTDQTFAFYVSEERDVRFTAVSAMAGGSLEPDPLTVETADGTVIHRALLPKSADTSVSQRTEIRLSALKPGLYRVRVWDDLDRFSFEVPRNLPFVVEAPVNSRFRVARLKTYFFVPKGTRQVAIYASSNTAPIIYSPADGHVRPVAYSYAGPNLLYFDVGGQDGRVWAFGEISSPAPIRFLNVPSVVSFSPEQMMIPRELAP